jgi:N-acyl amino acid synthase FeeM
MDVQQTSRFADRVTRLLEKVEYRRADTPADKAAIYRLRHDAYMRAGTIEPRPSGMFHDALDEAENAWLIGVFIDGELASALRLHISASVSAPLPTLAPFSDVLEPLLRSGNLIIDVTRFVAKLDFSQIYSEIPYLTLRPAFVAEQFLGADFIIAACRAEHQAFYRRMFGGVPWSSPRPYPHLKQPMALVGHPCRALRDNIYNRYPFYRSMAREQHSLLSQSSNRSTFLPRGTRLLENTR